MIVTETVTADQEAVPRSCAVGSVQRHHRGQPGGSEHLNVIDDVVLTTRGLSSNAMHSCEVRTTVRVRLWVSLHRC